MYLPTHSFNIFEACLIMEPNTSECDHSSQAGAELSTQASPALGATQATKFDSNACLCTLQILAVCTALAVEIHCYL